MDFLTDGIIQRLQAYHNDHPDVPLAWNPLYALIETVRGEIVGELARQGIAVDANRLDDTALLTRLVMKRCIYGVDLNPMAVELAKLSLWLHSFTVGAPLSFLDHHLRCGNALVGADVKTVERALQMTAQTQAVRSEAKRLAKGRGETARAAATGHALNLFGGPFAGLLDLTGIMLELVGMSDATLADVQQSAELYRTFQASLAPYKQALDLWVSQYFGNPAAAEFMTLYRDEVVKTLRAGQAVAPQYQQAIDRARELSAERRFFHWDLEFPEVFVDLERGIGRRIRGLMQ